MFTTHEDLEGVAVRKLRPSARRTLARARASLGRGSAAFLIGAGFDIAIAPQAPSWPALVAALLGVPSPQRSLAEAIDYWPLEMALWAKHRTESTDEFIKAIHESLPKATRSESVEEKWQTFGALLVRSNLIVTFNYSETVDDVVRDFAQGRAVIILDREDLAGFIIPEYVTKACEIYVIHLHGRCSVRSTPILDAWGYNVVSNSDPQYAAFLEQLFTKRDVISLGVSWKDVPLRNAAALVRRTKGYVGRAHVSFRHAAPEEEREFQVDAGSGLRGWANSMRAAYGVDPIVASESSQLILIRNLATPTTTVDIPPSIDDLPTVADFLDQTGDFESPQHTDWLLSAGESSTSETESRSSVVERATLRLAEAVSRALEVDALACWEVAARIERHLRHHLYLYAHNQGRDERRALWGALANSSSLLTRARWESLDDRLRFDFLVGAPEIALNGENVKHSSLLEGFWSKRLRLAKRVWQAKEAPTNDLALELLDTGWESLAAKVVGDRLLGLIQDATKRNAPPYMAVSIADAAERAGALARCAGATRRRLKADVVAAMWDSDPALGRLRILNALRRSEIEGKLEPGLYNGLIAGFLVSDARNYERRRIRRADLVKELLKAVAEIGFDKAQLNARQLKYWTDYAPAKSRSILTAVASSFAT